MKPSYTLRALTVICIASTLVLFAFTGCDHLQSIKPAVTNTNGDIGGSIEIVFKDFSGANKSLRVNRVGLRHRGFTTGGEFVTLGELRATAVAAYKAHQSGTDAARAKGYNGFDCDTVAIIVASLSSYNADPRSL